MPPQAPPPDPAIAKYMQAKHAHDAKVAEIEAAFKLLKDEKLRGFRVEIETDSTIQPDEDAEKQRRTEFVTAIGTLFQQAIPVVQQVPEMAPLIGEMLTFTVRGFRAGRTLEDQIEQTMQKVQQRVTQQLNNPPPDPAMQKVKAQIEGDKAKLQLEGQKAQQDGQIKQQTAQADMQMQQAQFGLDKQLAQDQAQLDMWIAMQEMNLKSLIAQKDSAIKAKQAEAAAKAKPKAAA